MTLVDASPDPQPEIPQGILAAKSGRRGGTRFPLVRFVVRRLVAGLLTLLVVSFLIFMVTNALPGNVADVVLGKNATPDRVEALESRLNLDQPLLVQYAEWLGNFVQGDFGQSAVRVAQGADDAPISAEIGVPLRNSLVLAALAALILLPVAVFVGVVAAIREGRLLDYTVSYVALVLGSVPEFVIGTILVTIFFSQLSLLPPVALVPPGASPLDHADALVLPVATLLAVSLSFCARQIRAGLVEVIHQPFITAARLNGIREHRVLVRYAIRNSLAPSVQSFAQTLQYLLGGIVVVEVLFAYPGIGQMLQNAVATRDIPLVQAIALILAAAYVAINILSDIIVVLLVPKLRTGLK